MTQLEVFLETEDGGRCVAHVPALLGLFVSSADRHAVSGAVTAAAARYHQWLERHGESAAAADQSPALHIAVDKGARDSLDPDRAAYAFAWDKEPLPPEELARGLQLAGYSRQDLLDLLALLPAKLLSWQPAPGEMSIGEVARHIGSAELWYLSRLAGKVDRSAAPEELTDYLAWSRQTAADGLLSLSTEALSQQFHPTHDTGHPEELWTARKAIRRLVEHELEHVDHIRELLDRWRLELYARIAAERDYFYWQLRGLDHDTLCQAKIAGDWTAKDLLIHAAVWDARHAARVAEWESGGASGEAVGAAVPGAPDDSNDSMRVHYQEMPLEQAVATSLKERTGFMSNIKRVPDHRFHLAHPQPGVRLDSIRALAEQRYRHDAVHAQELAAWRESQPKEASRSAGPKYVLRAMMHASRKAFLTAAALVPAAQRESLPVCGVWTLRDLLGHLTDWELVGIYALEELTEGRLPEFDPADADFEWFNSRHAAARKDQPWRQVMAEMHETRDKLMLLLTGLPGSLFTRRFPTPWGETTGYDWLMIWPGHEREHAVDLRRSLGLSGLPDYLLHAE